MELLPPPRSKIAKVLFALLTKEKVSEQGFRGINSFRSILSDLRHDYGIRIDFEWTEQTDEFGKPVQYKRHYLLPSWKKKAVVKYRKIVLA